MSDIIILVLEDEPEVRDAVAEGRFHLWAIGNVEEGWPVLAGRQAGEESEDGSYPDGSVHRAVQVRLEAWRKEWSREREERQAPRPDAEEKR